MIFSHVNLFKTKSNTISCMFKEVKRNLISKQLMYTQFGDPLDVVKIRECEVPPLGKQEVLVRMLAAPINPADINTIQGKYPVKIELPIVAGNEGVGTVEEVGQDVKGVRPGNKVIVTASKQGTWRDIAIFNKDVIKVVPDNLGLVEAATLTVNPCTAYRMLNDFKPVREKGLVVIQNGANSACGQNVIQLCKAWGIKNINVVRNRPEIDDLKTYLKSLGATYVLTEEELRSTTIFKDKLIEKPTLALNCVGGKSSLEMVRHLQHSGSMVTYGGMSREPVTVPTSAFIFKNISFFGFWMTVWSETANAEEKNKMMGDLVTLMCDQKVKGPIHKMVKFDQYQEALANAMTTKGFTGRQIFRPNLPTVPGDEGVGEVVEIGSKVCCIGIGNRVVLTQNLLGTWRYYGVYPEGALHRIPHKLPLAEASMLSVAPCTALRLISDFRHVEPGQTIMQNAANSPVGQCIIMLCKALGIKTMNIVANHYGYNAIKEYLTEIGGNLVCTLEEAEEMCSFSTALSRPVLAFNCLGGRYEDVMLQILECNGTLVYYGCSYDLPMVKQCRRPDASFYKFHYGKWSQTGSKIEKTKMLNKLVELIVIGKLQAPVYIPIQLKDYVHAFRNTVHCEAFATKSYIFDFTCP